MRFELSHDRRNISDDDLLSDLRRVASEQSEQQVKQCTYKEHGKYGVTTVIRRFGSWNAAVKTAGLETSVERNIPDEKLFSSLYDLWVALGRQPSYSEVQKPACQFHVATFERRFGSWRQALEAFVSYANSEDMAAPVVSEIAGAVLRRSSRSPDLRLRFKGYNATASAVVHVAHLHQLRLVWCLRLTTSNRGQKVARPSSRTYKRSVLPAIRGKQTTMKGIRK